MSNTAKRALFNYKFGMLSVYAGCIDIRFIVTAYTRTAAEQSKLYKEGKSKLDGYKKKSYHQLDRARDIVIIDGNDMPIWEFTSNYTRLGEFWESLGGVWGGRWESLKDCYHFQH